MLLALLLAAAPLCNGRADLCSRPYNRATFAATHDSYAAADYVPNVLCAVPLYCPITNIGFVDQQHGITQQLHDGIRAFDLRLLPDTQGGHQLCHAIASKCQLQVDFIKKFLTNPKDAFTDVSMAFSTPDAVLAEFATWMAANPREVITISLQLRDTPDEVLRSLLRRHGLDKLVHKHAVGRAFATLGQMLASGQRLVIFTDHGATNDGWLYAGTASKPGMVFDVGSGWQHKLSAKDVVNDCSDPLPNPLAVDAVLAFAHHLTNSFTALPQLEFNTVSLEQHLYNCYKRLGLAPTFVSVDRYAHSWVNDAVAHANAGNIQAPKGIWKEITDGGKCGFDNIVDAGKCGTEKIKDGAQCGFERGLAKLAHHAPKACTVPKSCKQARTCRVKVN